MLDVRGGTAADPAAPCVQAEGDKGVMRLSAGRYRRRPQWIQDFTEPGENRKPPGFPGNTQHIEVFIMNKIARTLLIACAVAVPAISFAQTAPATRAQERAELVQLEATGWRPGVNPANYPADIQAAEGKVHPQQVTVQLPATRVMASTTPRIDAPRSAFYYGA
jgi:hypothetical protein